LAARFFEERRFSTVVLTPTHDFHRSVGIPRSVAIEYPYGRPLGDVGDVAGQTAVLTATLAFLEEAQRPGEVQHLPFTWREAPKETHWHPPHMSPIIKAHLPEIKAARNRGRVN
jgi:hypothetical protein